ncbi:ABC-type transport system, ATPase component [Alteracholeplasma palmae J233]|uniref:ABC-type transport system, ATPase component n=1 Tax=Alteracholeplasma palmae (strain ATCC 49389 / J233) TaxID=1318466 RepID=U4KJV4_ALTPJ|nr:ABC transporter ATP-binding protein [Alteracholeplasma palmae]CCV63742.1 ABC-type transport system, ATPase component [Alteracholeplasma palmae J233]
MRQTILEVKDLTKTYKDVKAVDNISFTVKKGSLFAFLGPNGAGKSTTIKMITTLLKPDSGMFLLNGISDENEIRNKIGVVFQENVLDDFLTVKENLLARGALYIKDKKQVLERYMNLKEKFELEEIENRRFKNLSGGQKRRVEIARALFSNPEILLLDEPTTGLDPETRQQVWKTLDKLKNDEGITIFLTTHYMEEAQDADYIVIINKGTIEVSGTPSELKSKYSHDRIKIVPKDKASLEQYLKSIDTDYKKIADQYIIKVKDTEQALNYVTDMKENISQIEIVKGTLDDVFVNVIGELNV